MLQGLDYHIFFFILDLGLWSLILTNWDSSQTIVKSFDLFQLELDAGTFILATFLVSDSMGP